MALVALGLSLPAHRAPAGADVLVMKDGSRVETDGPWEVRGRMVRFTSPSGTLSAVRLSEVDLDASEEATYRAANPPPEPVEEAPAPRAASQPVLVITDADIPRGEVLVEDDDEEEVVDTSKAVRVTTWDYSPGDGTPAFELTGTIQNFGNLPAENIQVFVDLIGVGTDGQPNPDIHLLREALVISSTLAAGETTDFRYGVTNNDLGASGDPDAFVQPTANFDVRFRLGAPDDEEPDGGLP